MFFVQSALQLTEVLKERDAQVEFNQLKLAASKGQDRANIERTQKELEKAIIKEQNDAQLRLEAARQNKDFIKAQ